MTLEDEVIFKVLLKIDNLSPHFIMGSIHGISGEYAQNPRLLGPIVECYAGATAKTALLYTTVVSYNIYFLKPSMFKDHTCVWNNKRPNKTYLSSHFWIKPSIK